MSLSRHLTDLGAKLDVGEALRGEIPIFRAKLIVPWLQALAGDSLQTGGADDVVQRFDKEVRGLVRQIDPIDANLERIKVELFTRLTPIEVSVLKMGIEIEGGHAEKRWY